MLRRLESGAEDPALLRQNIANMAILKQVLQQMPQGDQLATTADPTVVVWDVDAGFRAIQQVTVHLVYEWASYQIHVRVPNQRLGHANAISMCVGATRRARASLIRLTHPRV